MKINVFIWSKGQKVKDYHFYDISMKCVCLHIVLMNEPRQSNPFKNDIRSSCDSSTVLLGLLVFSIMNIASIRSEWKESVNGRRSYKWFRWVQKNRSDIMQILFWRRVKAMNAIIVRQFKNIGNGCIITSPCQYARVCLHFYIF